jgi:hypothetical protein
MSDNIDRMLTLTDLLFSVKLLGSLETTAMVNKVNLSFLNLKVLFQLKNFKNQQLYEKVFM